ncbi:MAG: helix-turn-helix transcriptional regulator [bacterium]
MSVIREVVGETIRGIRLRQQRTLRQVSSDARVSLGYLSEIERGHKEASSELLAAICDALGVRLSDVFAEVSDTLRRQEKVAERALTMSSARSASGALPPTLATPAGGLGTSGRGTATVRARAAA